jgi:ketosteroid isomerase-like protein
MSEDARKVIDELFKSYFEGLRQGDVASVVALYTENAIQLPPNRKITRGRQQIGESSKEAVQEGFENAILTEREVSISGDVAYECGSYTEKFHLKGKEPLEISGKYLIVFKRTADGWKIDRELWNTQTA